MRGTRAGRGCSGCGLVSPLSPPDAGTDRGSRTVARQVRALPGVRQPTQAL